MEPVEELEKLPGPPAWDWNMLVIACVAIAAIALLLTAPSPSLLPIARPG
jgi:hypothetical protein